MPLHLVVPPLFELDVRFRELPAIFGLNGAWTKLRISVR